MRPVAGSSFARDGMRAAVAAGLAARGWSDSRFGEDRERIGAVIDRAVGTCRRAPAGSPSGAHPMSAPRRNQGWTGAAFAMLPVSLFIALIVGHVR